MSYYICSGMIYHISPNSVT